MRRELWDTALVCRLTMVRPVSTSFFYAIVKHLPLFLYPLLLNTKPRWRYLSGTVSPFALIQRLVFSRSFSFINSLEKRKLWKAFEISLNISCVFLDGQYKSNIFQFCFGPRTLIPSLTLDCPSSLLPSLWSGTSVCANKFCILPLIDRWLM